MDGPSKEVLDQHRGHHLGRVSTPGVLALYVRDGQGDHPVSVAPMPWRRVPPGFLPTTRRKCRNWSPGLAFHGESVNLERSLGGKSAADMPLRLRRRFSRDTWP